MADSDFQIIFDKLTDASQKHSGEIDEDFVSDKAKKELEDIAELVRLSNDLSVPDVTCYTTT